MAIVLKTLVSFNGTDGSVVQSGLIADANGDLFGTTGQGGAYGDGTVFEIVNTGTIADPSYGASITLASLNGTTGSDASTGLTMDANGNLLVAAGVGGTYGDGTVFEIVNTGTISAPSYASVPTTLFSFNGANGSTPEGGLIADANGNLFGTTAQGGASGQGTVFEIVNTGTVAAPSYASAPTTLVSFNGANGSEPETEAALFADAKGDLFGTTVFGGANGQGTAFEIVNTGTIAAPSYASAPTTLVSFNGANGSHPYGSLTADAKGDLFGTTRDGGANGDGAVFEIVNIGSVAAPSYASAPTTLISFNGADGAGPLGGVVADANGDLFGTTRYGGTHGDGTVFEIVNTGTMAAPNYASVPTTVFSFDNGVDGSLPYDGLTVDANGNLFGTTEEGGASGDGAVFEITGAGFVTAVASWANDVSGKWSAAAYWTSGALPVSSDYVSIPTGVYAYTVTSQADVTVSGIATGATTTLHLTGGTFDDLYGTWSDGNAGTIEVGGAAVFDIDGAFDNATTGVISANAAGAVVNLVGGSISGGTVEIGGTLDAMGGASAPSTIGGGAVVTGDGVVEATNDTTLTLAGATIDGTLTTMGGGVIETALGTDSVFDVMTISQNSVVTVVDNSSLTLEGTITNDGTIDLSSVSDPTTLMMGANVSLKGGGQLLLSDAAANNILGSAAGETLTNVNNTISGAGSIGDGDQTLTLHNQALGIIDATGANALTIDTGNTVTNAGILEATNPGGLSVTGGFLINDAVANSGIIEANGGNVTILGALSGAGEVQIFNGNSVTLGSSATNGVIFEGGGSGSAALILNAAENFSGKVTGLVPNDSIDLTDFLFSGNPTVSKVTVASASQTNVTVKDGALSETLHLVTTSAGEFGTSASDFQLTSDGGNNNVHIVGTLFHVLAA